MLSRGLIDLLLDDFGHLLKLVIDEILDSNLGLAKLSLETLNLLGDRGTDLVVDASDGLLGDEEAGVRIKIKDELVSLPLTMVLYPLTTTASLLTSMQQPSSIALHQRQSTPQQNANS